MKNKIKIITAFILGVLFTSVTVYAITVKSNNVTFTPDDTDWEVTNVDDALNDLFLGLKNKSVEPVTGSFTSYKYDQYEKIELGFKPSSVFVFMKTGSGDPYFRTIACANNTCTYYERTKDYIVKNVDYDKVILDDGFQIDIYSYGWGGHDIKYFAFK